MNDICPYQIILRGQVNESEINATSPIHIAVVKAGTNFTLLNVCTDQSGLVGLIRHIHAKGFLILSLNREERIERL